MKYDNSVHNRNADFIGSNHFRMRNAAEGSEQLIGMGNPDCCGLPACKQYEIKGEKRMKKIIPFIVLLFLLTGCESPDVEVSPTVDSVQMEYSDFDLVTDQKTGIVYIENEIIIPGEYGSHYYQIYTPYYGKNGKPCRFVDGRVVEIE